MKVGEEKEQKFNLVGALSVDRADEAMLRKVGVFLEETTTGMSQIQIEDFVLNDVEYPTRYGKFCQAKSELSQRFSQITELYYEIKETEIEIEQKAEKSFGSVLDRKLSELQREKLELRLLRLKTQLEVVLREMRIFYKVYRSNPGFHNLSEDEVYQLEREQWIEKTFNMPIVFEERYGERYMREAVGAKCYQEYQELRKQKFGLLPREILNRRRNDNEEESSQICHRCTNTTSRKIRRATSCLSFLEKA